MRDQKGENMQADQNHKSTTVGIFNSHQNAEDTVRSLKATGFKMDQLSIVGKDQSEDQGSAYYHNGEQMKTWGKQGAFWGGIWGLLMGSAFFALPGFGPLLVAGPLAVGILGALEGATAVGNLSALGAGLFSFGIPEKNLTRYEAAIRDGNFVLLAHLNPEEIEQARALFQKNGAIGEVETFEV